MRVFRIIVNLSLVIALAVMGAVSGVYANGDANGDQSVDVRDLQLVICQVLNSHFNNTKGDVNGDGRVDILDYQYILAQASSARDGSASTIPEPERRAAQNPSPQRSLGVLAARLHIPVADSDQAGHSKGSALAYGAWAPLRTLRYSFRLTPNAPPQAA
jgi:hypothetical protein